jgi:calcineurin-like phosphoesterase
MDFLVDIIFWFIVIWLVSKFILFYLQAKNEILKEEIDDLTQKLKDKIIQVNVEQHGSVFYLFEKDTNRFIAQGSDIIEIKKKCADRFKDAVIVADTDELKKYGLE